MKMKLLALSVVLIMALSACTSNGGGTSTDGTAGTAGGTGDVAASNTGSGEIANLKWITVGGGQPNNYDAWRSSINAYLAETIGVNIDIEVVSWGDWGDRRNVIVTSGEYFDILFTDSGRYTTEAKMGAFLDISDMLKSASPDLYAYIPGDYWNAVRVEGKIYSVPTYKDSSATNYFVWDKNLADENGIDYSGISTLAAIYEPLAKLKESTGQAPFVLNKDGVSAITYPRYDGLGAELPPLGVRFDDQSRTVVNVLLQDEVKSELAVVHEMYKNGIINADAPTLGETPSYRMCFMAQGWSGAAKTVWGPNNGMEAVAIQTGDTIVSNGTVRGSLNGVYSGSKNPEKALAFLQAANLDVKLRDALYYGLEGDDFEYTADGKIDRKNTDWTMAGYTQGTFFNVSQLATDEFNQWDEVKQLNDNAKGSVLLGFDLDTTNIENELANCRVVWEKYKSELMTGAKDPAVLIETVTNELESSGFSKIIQEAQSQIDAAF